MGIALLFFFLLAVNRILPILVWMNYMQISEDLLYMQN
jgi:hypothetical protein